MKNLIITTYFTQEVDPQRPFIWPNDEFSIIKDFYESVVKHDLDLLILHDNCSNEFVNKYTTDKINWLRVDSTGLNMVDIRWRLYANELSWLKLDNVFFMDISDVVILKNPFDYIQDKIYIGDELSINSQNRWMMDRYKMLGVDNTSYLNDVVLNCGVMGGKYEDMLSVATKMADLMDKAIITNTTVDMSAANHILYTEYRDRIMHGQPLTTKYRGGANPYRGNDNGADHCYIQHK
jgi:hypothetical protein